LYGQSSFIPKNLGPSVNSVYDEINPVISPDGSTIYFVRVNHPENKFGEYDSEDVWFSNRQTDGTWSAAQRDIDLNVGRHNAILSFSADGNTALINGIHTWRGIVWKKRGLSITKKTENGWSVPEKIKVSKLSKRNRGVKSSGMMSSDGKVIVFSFSRTYNGKKSNLFYCLQKSNGNYSRPRIMKSLKSMGSSEDAPFLQADNKTLYFSSDRNQKGEFDIFKTTRLSEDWKEWSNPIKLNDTINSAGWDSYLRTTPKGGWAYFASTEKSIGGADIFTVKLFEENPFVVISGRVVNAKNKQPLIGKKIKVDMAGVPSDSIHINADSATYKVTLPLGKLYSLSARVKHYRRGSAQVDMSGVKEFTRIKKDLLLESMPYVLVKGTIRERGSSKPIPAGANAKINLEGTSADSVSIDPATGAYALKVLFGTAYKINVAADGYRPVPATLDLSMIDEYQEMPLDVYVDEERSATVLGNIIDKKTGNPISKAIRVVIHVEGMAAVRATIDSIAGKYELKLPLGGNYTISASAPNYYPLYEAISTNNENSNVRIYKDLIIVPIEVGQSIRLNNIFFEIAKSKLKTESFSELNRVVQFLKDNPDIKIEISGHTDDVGKVASNIKLSEARAAAVGSYIISKGIPKSNIVTKGYGSTKPVASNKTKAGKAQNRRVEFTILDK
jgi:outer membrane protein OmpA-like peptidoglycan-associated protein